MKLSNYKTLPAFETNLFEPGDTIICYDSEVSADPEIVEDVDGDKILLRNYDFYIDYRTCRKLIRRKPKEFFVLQTVDELVIALNENETYMKDMSNAYKGSKVFKVIEILED